MTNIYFIGLAYRFFSPVLAYANPQSLNPLVAPEMFCRAWAGRVESASKVFFGSLHGRVCFLKC